ncbi:MAG: hypothetical protein KF723_01915 [Rhizobiaceae bacterium]|nr:hypothetical protein [Rhizobiaceae bacterium]
MDSERAFEAFVKSYLGSRMPEMEASIAALESQTNLIGSGVIDSFIFIDLCLAIEEESRVPLDVAEIDFDQFSISGLWSYVSARRS